MAQGPGRRAQDGVMLIRRHLGAFEDVKRRPSHMVPSSDSSSPSRAHQNADVHPIVLPSLLIRRPWAGCPRSGLHFLFGQRDGSGNLLVVPPTRLGVSESA